MNGPDSAELKVCEIETRIVKTLQGHSRIIKCIDISVDNTLLASGSTDETVRIWNLETCNLVAGPFESLDDMGAVRFSTDSKKLAAKLWAGKCLEVWDVQSQKLDVRIGEELTPTTSTDMADSAHLWRSRRDEIPTGFVPPYVGISGDSKVNLASDCPTFLQPLAD
jgi:WD40 repeat protein